MATNFDRPPKGYVLLPKDTVVKAGDIQLYGIETWVAVPPDNIGKKVGEHYSVMQARPYLFARKK